MRVHPASILPVHRLRHERGEQSELLRDLSHDVPEVDLQEKNKATAWGAKRSAGFDWTREDKADPMLLNEIIWRSDKGARSPMPPPVRAAFFIPRLQKDD